MTTQDRRARTAAQTPDAIRAVAVLGGTRHEPHASAQEMRAYLGWETGLVDRIRRGREAPFPGLPET
jgi:hypothetical protein